MKLHKITPNLKELIKDNGVTILFSYKTAVAAHIEGKGYFKSNKFYTMTTAQHIGKWLRDNDATPSKVTLVDPSFFDTL